MTSGLKSDKITIVNCLRFAIVPFQRMVKYGDSASYGLDVHVFLFTRFNNDLSD